MGGRNIGNVKSGNPLPVLVLLLSLTARLLQAASGANEEEISDLLKQVETEHEELVMALRDLVDNFRYDKIVELAQAEGDAAPGDYP